MCNKTLSILSLILISVILVTGFTFIPAVRLQASVQQPQVQQNTSDVSRIVKQIADEVAAANPGTNATFIEQILTELAKLSAQVSTQDNVLEEIYSQISTYPYGIISQSLARFASLLSTDNTILIPAVQKITQEQASGKNVLQSIVNIAV